MISFTCKKNDQQQFWIAKGYGVQLHKFFAIVSTESACKWDEIKQKYIDKSRLVLVIREISFLCTNALVNRFTCSI